MKNKIIKICVGVPASGKTTWSKKFVSENEKWVRICRDDFRFMLKNAPVLQGKGEELITSLVNESIEKAIVTGFNVILDATHVKLSYINEIIKSFNDMADIEFEVFDISFDECVERDKNREKKVGKTVIEKMQKDFDILKKEFKFESFPQKPRIKIDYSKNWKESLPNAIIFDVDGTLAHMNGKRGPFEWHNVGVDDLDHVIARQFKLHKSNGDTIIVVSGRDESCKKETIQWLNSNDLYPDEIFMRPEGDYRKDSIIKKEIYENFLKDKFNVILIYDDRDQVVKVWRDLGLKCIQVEPGNF
jgi:predicted kinase